jgi:hypothetical protein
MSHLVEQFDLRRRSYSKYGNAILRGSDFGRKTAI